MKSHIPSSPQAIGMRLTTNVPVRRNQVRRCSDFMVPKFRYLLPGDKYKTQELTFCGLISKAACRSSVSERSWNELAPLLSAFFENFLYATGLGVGWGNLLNDLGRHDVRMRWTPKSLRINRGRFNPSRMFLICDRSRMVQKGVGRR